MTNTNNQLVTQEEIKQFHITVKTEEDGFLRDGLLRNKNGDRAKIVFQVPNESRREFNKRRNRLHGKGIHTIVVNDGGYPPNFKTIGDWNSIQKQWVDGFKKVCPCGKLFESEDPRRIYCPDGDCRKQAYITKRRSKTPKPREQRCLNCDGILEARRGTKFCGNTCCQTYRRKRLKLS